MTADNGVLCSEQSLLGNLAMIKGGGLKSYWTDTEVYRLSWWQQSVVRVFEKRFTDLGGEIREQKIVEASRMITPASAFQ